MFVARVEVRPVLGMSPPSPHQGEAPMWIGRVALHGREWSSRRVGPPPLGPNRTMCTLGRALLPSERPALGRRSNWPLSCSKWRALARHNEIAWSRRFRSVPFRFVWSRGFFGPFARVRIRMGSRPATCVSLSLYTCERRILAQLQNGFRNFEQLQEQKWRRRRRSQQSRPQSLSPRLRNFAFRNKTKMGPDDGLVCGPSCASGRWHATAARLPGASRKMVAR